MHRKIFIDQLKRSKKTVVYFWLLLIEHEPVLQQHQQFAAL